MSVKREASSVVASARAAKPARPALPRPVTRAPGAHWCPLSAVLAKKLRSLDDITLNQLLSSTSASCSGEGGSEAVLAALAGEAGPAPTGHGAALSLIHI